MKYKPYPKYKDSGIEWLGEIPEEWELRKIKFLAKEPIKNGLGESAEFFEENWPRYIRITDIEGPKKLKDDTFCSLPSEIASGALVKKGDLLMSAVGATYGKSYLHLYDKGDFCYAGYLVKFSPNKELDFRYVGYWSESDLYWNQVHSNVIQSTIQNFSANKYQQLLILLPSLQEQIKIANYLDKKTEKINILIEKNKKQIELLKEKRQALISQAVTKGLNSKVKMKDSGIDWIGEIPEEWEQWKLSHLFNVIGSGTTPASENLNYYDGTIPWVKTGELNDGEINDTEDKVTERAVNELSALKIFPKDSLLIAMYGATIGKISILKIPATTNQACCVLGDSKKTDIKYIFYYFLAYRPHLIALSYGGGQPNISQDTIRSVKIFLPSIEKQKSITDFLDRETMKIDEVMEKIKNQIEKLKEFHQSLISNVVTGKIKIG